MSDINIPDTQPERDEVASKHFRIIFANNFDLRVNDNEVALTFGVDVGETRLANIVTREVTVMMTPRSAKTLWFSLQVAIEALEKNAGSIALPPGRFEELAKALKQTTTTRSRE